MRLSEWELPKAGLDLRYVEYDAAHEDLLLVQDRRTGKYAKVFGSESAGRSATTVIESDAELESVLATVARVRGRHDYNGEWRESEWAN
jgi:hypothetical protein